MERLATTLVNHFLRGALVLLPVVGSLYAVWYTLSTIDGLVGGILPVALPGLGVLLSVAVIIGTGAMASNVVGRRLVGWIEGWMDDLPFIRLLYGSIRDMMQAFVGENKTLDHPVVVTVGDGVRVLGFLTREHFEEPELSGMVGVYLPQTYNFAGNLILVPAERVERLHTPGADFFALILSGGMSRG